MMRVLKFGGTSVGSAEAITAVVEITQREVESAGRTLIVASATSGTTSELLSIASQAVTRRDHALQQLAALQQRHHELASTLLVAEETALHAAIQDLDELFNAARQLVESMHILEEHTLQSCDALLATGEQASTTLLTHVLRAHGLSATLFPADRVVVTDDTFGNATVNLQATREACDLALRPLLQTGTVVVTQGFLGATQDGRATTLGRGGSDASAALLGACLEVDEVQIWTDVSGVYSADPRDVPSAHPVPSLHVGEVRDLALYGAKVLHPEAILPAIEAGIHVRVLNTFAPHDQGTLITKEPSAHGDLHAVSVVPHCMMVRGSASIVQKFVGIGVVPQRLVLHGASIDHAFAIVRTATAAEDTDVSVALVGLDLTATPVGVVLVTGPTAQSPSTLQRISEVLQDVCVLAVLTGTSSWSIFIVVAHNHVHAAQRALHLLVHPSDSSDSSDI